MTVQTNTNVASFNGNGVTQIFPIAFKFNKDTDLVVLLADDATGVSATLTLNSDYTVSGEGDEEGGLINVVVAPAVGKRLFVSRVVDILQMTDLRNQGKFFAEVHEDAFDLLTMIAQQHETGIRSSLRVADSDPEPARIPSAAFRAGKLLSFDGDGNPQAVAPVTDSSAALRLVLAESSDPREGAAIVGRAIRFFRSIRLVGGGDGELQTVAGQYDGETVQVLGYWDDMPGEGGGLYTWFATNTLPADGAVIVAPNGVSTGRWIMRPRETYFEDFGARGDGATDDYAAMNLAVTSIYSKMFPVRMKSRTYASSQMLVVGDKVSLIGSGTFVSMIRALPGFVGTAVIQYYAPDSGINSVEIKNFRVSCNGQDVHGFDLRRMYDAVLISGLMCIDAPDTKNAFRLVGHTDAAPITIGQTVRIEALFMGHANSTATAATCYIQKLQEAVFTECKSWGCYGSSKAASVPWEIEDCRSLTFIQPSAVTSTGYGFKIRSIGRTTRNINLISPLYENIDGMIDAQGADADFIVINVRQENPRYETVTTGGYNFAFTNSCEVDLFNRPATVASTAAQTLLYTGDASNISNSSTTTTILRRANAVSRRYSVGPSLEVTAQDGSTVHLRTLEPSASTCSLMVAHNNGSTTTLKQVTVGAADSAGTGFRTLRIAN